MNTPTAFIGYTQAAYTFGVSVRHLSDLVAAGKLTRHISAKDRRKVLLSVQELTEYFHGTDYPTAA